MNLQDNFKIKYQGTSSNEVKIMEEAMEKLAKHYSFEGRGTILVTPLSSYNNPCSNMVSVKIIEGNLENITKKLEANSVGTLLEANSNFIEFKVEKSIYKIKFGHLENTE